MHPVLIQIGKFQIYSYGFMLALGFVVALLLCLRLARREGFPRDTIVDVSLLAVLAGIIGSRLTYVFLYDWPYFSQHPLEILNLRNQGLVFQGGLVLAVVAVGIYVVVKRVPFWPIADIMAVFISLGYGIARIGCFLNGCCYGKVTDVPWGVVFPGLGDLPRHPTQLYSSFSAVILFLFLYWFYPRRRFDGQVFILYLIGYSIIRFIIEFWRENLIVWQHLTVAQVTALVIIILSVPLYLWLRNRAARAD